MGYHTTQFPISLEKLSLLHISLIILNTGKLNIFKPNKQSIISTKTNKAKIWLSLYTHTLWAVQGSHNTALKCAATIFFLKAAKYEIQKPSTCRATLFRCKFSSMFPVFRLGVTNLSHNKNICCGLEKFVAKSRARVYFEQQILVLLLVFHQTHNLSRNKFARALANQPISALHFFNPQQCFCCGSS